VLLTRGKDGEDSADPEPPEGCEPCVGCGWQPRWVAIVEVVVHGRAEAAAALEALSNGQEHRE
jgi:hypothetical protein